ncbi:pleckstrin homology-like domain family A member 2 [Pleurodeles waltl]|uniref:pleckstrin homology-like domain family A member 2 n=1 Tax=Pleurodeles waltl TaxID=8319 RepID=UPI0037094DE9
MSGQLPASSRHPPVIVLKEGELEKRGGGILQRWKRRRCVLTSEGLRYSSGGSAKELRFEALARLECIERAGERLYFTLVGAGGRERDFRCGAASGWHAQITLALVAFQNSRAVEELRAHKREARGAPGRRLRSWAG